MKRRPAETTAAAGGLAGLVLGIVSGEPTTVVVAAVGFLPAVVTWIDVNGGLAGAWRRVLHGKQEKVATMEGARRGTRS